MKINGDLLLMLATVALCATLIAAAIVLWPAKVHGQQRTFYGADGRVSGRAATDTQGTTTFYDAGGRKVGSATNQKRSK